MVGIRNVLVLVIFLLGIALGFANIVHAREVPVLDPTQLEKFVDEIHVIPRIKGFDYVDGSPVSKTLHIGMFRKKWKFHRDLPATTVFAYGTSKKSATVPGPTIEALHKIPTYVNWTNHLPSKHILPFDNKIPTAMPSTGVPTVVHLHGGINEPHSDGHSTSWFTNGFKHKGETWAKEVYDYNNAQHPGTLWYHDHAMGLTRVNLLAGLTGAYVLRDPSVEEPMGLPCGEEYDLPLIISDRDFLKDGSIYMNPVGNIPELHPQWQPEYFGNVTIVNGKAWPYMAVRRRKYRFRIINASNARFYNLSFSNNLPFTHIGSDSSYNRKPVVLKNFLIAPSEIADVIVDFSKSLSKSAILTNSAKYPFPDGDSVDEQTNKVMKFVIKHEHVVDTTKIPSTLLKYPKPRISSAVKNRYIALLEYEANEEPKFLLINGKKFTDPVTETPKVGTTEIWNVINLTGDNHPLHIHIGLFTALDQTNLVEADALGECVMKYKDVTKCDLEKHIEKNNTVPVLKHESGWKNTYKMLPGYLTRIAVKFSYIHTEELYRFDATAEPGYAYHCHILDHEDNTMMRPMRLIK